MRRLAVLTALALLALVGGPSATPAAAKTNPNCRAGTTLALINGKAQCLRARARCRTKLDRQYRASGYRCRKGKRRRGGKRRPARLTLGSAAKRRGPDVVAIRPNGSVGKQDALRAFERAIGPMPGVKVKRGEVGRITSGTGPYHWVKAHRGRLTAAQRRAFDDYRAKLFPAVSASSADAATAKTYLDQAVGRLAARLGEPLGVSTTVTLGPPDGDALATAETVVAAGKKVCHVSVTPLGLKESEQELRSALTHEAFHCFQEKWNESGYGAATLWLWEGSANFATALIDAERGYPSELIRSWWTDWLETPEITLFARAYSAVGFFGHLNAQGVGFWTHIKPWIKLPDSNAVYAAATGGATTGPRILDTWGPSYHRVVWPGPGWTFTGPFIPPAKPTIPHPTLTNGETFTVTSLDRAAAVRRIKLSTEVLTVSGTANGRLTDVEGNQRPLAPGDYCTKPGGCTCPAGKPGPPDDLKPSILVGVTGHDKVATVKFRGQRLEDWCEKPGGRLTITGALGGVATGVGTCSVTGDGEFQAIIETDKSPRRFLQMDTGSYAGPGGYAATGRGVTSGPRVWVTDGMGTEYGTDHQPEGATAGGFTVSSDTAKQMSGTVDATMFSPGGGSGASASGTWVCDKI